MKPINSIVTMSDQLESHPIIAAVRDDEALKAAIAAPVSVIFLLNASLTNLKSRNDHIRDHGKLSFIHLDMVAGLSKDQWALDYLKTEIAPTGIITTKPNLIEPARALGLYAIERLFLLDSLSIQTGLKMIQDHHPDFVEIMPGVIPKVVSEIKRHSPVPIIAGGMIDTKQEIVELLKMGVIAVSTSRSDLWNL